MASKKKKMKVSHIVVWEESGDDPVKTFGSRETAIDHIKYLITDEEVDPRSVRLFEVSRENTVKMNIELTEVK